MVKLREYKFDLNNLKWDVKKFVLIDVVFVRDDFLEFGMVNYVNVSVFVIYFSDLLVV